MRQRLALARAVALDADLLLMDEPLSALDALKREDLQDVLLELWQRRGHTQVLVTHSIEEAVFLGRRVVVMTPRPGRVAAIVDNPGMGGAGYRDERGVLHAALRRSCAACSPRRARVHAAPRSAGGGAVKNPLRAQGRSATSGALAVLLLGVGGARGGGRLAGAAGAGHRDRRRSSRSGPRSGREIARSAAGASWPRWRSGRRSRCRSGCGSAARRAPTRSPRR